MAELLAQGREPAHRWQQALLPRQVTLGRTAESAWQVPWDPKISRVHAILHWQNGVLDVRRHQRSLNPIFFQGTARDEFQVPPGSRFIIGDTTFSVLATAHPHAVDMPHPNTELTISPEELRRYRFVDADLRLEVLASLPGVVRFSPNETALNEQALAVLLRGIPRADNAALLRLRLQSDGSPVIEIRQVNSRGNVADQFAPSRRLVLDAMLEKHQSVLHVWQPGDLQQAYTVPSTCNWALCIPLTYLTPLTETLSGPLDQPGELLGFYLNGSLPVGQAIDSRSNDLLKSDLKFTELVADLFGSLRQVGDLQRRLGQYTSFLPRPVINVLSSMNDKAVEDFLRPQPAQVTVLFCDIRSSCRIAEQGQQDLMRLWNHVSTALGIMSSSILKEDGVIGDFQGDAIMAFWGWPLGEENSIDAALQAAQTILTRMADLSSTLTGGEPAGGEGGFRCGIGIAHGPAVVGRLGTPDQFKIGVFGPTVNLAARLESLTKQWGVSILMDEECAIYLARKTVPSKPRYRRLARVQPAGMDLKVNISEVVVGDGAAGSGNSAYEQALKAFEDGRWDEARSTLTSLLPDGPSSFLLQYIADHPHGPAADWDGTLALKTK